MPSAEDYRSAKKAMSAKYLAKTAESVLAFAASASLRPSSNVVGVGIGLKYSAGKETKTRCVRFYVAEKIHKSSLSVKNMLPADVDGIPTDVIVTGRFRARNTASENKLKRRPIRPGTSIGFRFPDNSAVMAGTFGAVVSKGGNRFILSNNHVIAGVGLIAAGAPIFQPGLLDGGSAATDAVAKLGAVIDIKKAGANKVDCALAEILPGAAVNPRHMPNVGKLASTNPIAAAEGMLVMKTGRTTGHTRGRIVDVSADVVVGYEDKDGNEFGAAFNDQILIEGTPNPGGFSTSGDSGSLIVDRATKRATGLLFAGSSVVTIANHISEVLAALGVTLETA